MKKYNYFWARASLKITGIILLTQIIIESSGVVVRRTGFEYTVHFCAVLFLISALYSLALILLNAKAISKT